MSPIFPYSTSLWLIRAFHGDMATYSSYFFSKMHSILLWCFFFGKYAHFISCAWRSAQLFWGSKAEVTESARLSESIPHSTGRVWATSTMEKDAGDSSMSFLAFSEQTTCIKQILDARTLCLPSAYRCDQVRQATRTRMPIESAFSIDSSCLELC